MILTGRPSRSRGPVPYRLSSASHPRWRGDKWCGLTVEGPPPLTQGRSARASLAAQPGQFAPGVHAAGDVVRHCWDAIGTLRVTRPVGV